MSNENKDQYNAIHSYFIGPKGANLPDFRANVNTILDELLEARLNYYPEDNSQRFISRDVRRSKEFLEVRDNLSHAVRKVAQLLGERSVPFWSPRYEAHMCMDLTMPSLLGYFMTMLYNPNNVALEASPITTLAELRVGKQLCDLFGYNNDETKPPAGWGHITCDGTVANLESVWVARNLKFYPLALHRAVTASDGKLQFIKDKFKVTPCKKGSEPKLFSELSQWELLNLRLETVLDLPEKLNKQFGISSEFLKNALEKYNIQTAGRKPLEDEFKITKPIQYFVGKSRHYSWPKSAAIAGIGSGNMTGVEVDNEARIDLGLLKTKLEECVQKQKAVYAVVGIVGSTEEGAVDRLEEIVKLREKFQDEHGLYFVIHADAAWGGYFATMLRRTQPSQDQQEGVPVPADQVQNRTQPANAPHAEKFVPALTLKKETERDLLALKHADSITVDPHKAGYIPYPAGSLVYRDGRMRHLVTWSSPYLSQGSAENIGVYGVEGSKPGAAAMSAWFSNQTIGLNPDGYGMLLGEAAFTSGRLSAHWATIDNDYFVCVPFNKLSSEGSDPKDFLTSAAVKDEKARIKNQIVDKDNVAILASADATETMRKLGSDLNINAFALNWRDDQGNLNTDLEEANRFMKRVVDRLSITSANTNPSKIPLFLTSTEFEPDGYGACAQHFMERMGLVKCKQNLFVLRNVVMSPFPTQRNFIHPLMEKFKEIAKEEVEECRRQNESGKYKIQFLLQGPPEPTASTRVFLVLQTSFHSPTRRQQLIFSATLDEDLIAFYKSLIGQTPEDIVVESAKALDIENADEALRNQNSVTLRGKMYRKTYPSSNKTGTVTLKSVVKSRPLNSANRDSEYPEQFMPFYLYGTETEKHISHILVRSPNIGLRASNVTFTPDLPATVTEHLPEGLILTIPEIHEASMQPFPMKNKDLPEDFFFQSGAEFTVAVREDKKPGRSEGPGLLEDLGPVLYHGKMTLGEQISVDAEEPNKDRFSRINVDSDSWQKELDEIGSVLKGSSTA